MAEPWDEYSGSTAVAEPEPWKDYQPAPVGPTARDLETQRAPEGSSEYLATHPVIPAPEGSGDANLFDAYKQGGVLGAFLAPHKVTDVVEAVGHKLPEATTGPEKVAKVLATAPLSLADFLTSPEGLATAALGATGPLARTALAGGFGLTGASDTIEGIRQGDVEKATGSALVTLLSTLGLKSELGAPKVAGAPHATELQSKLFPETAKTAELPITPEASTWDSMSPQDRWNIIAPYYPLEAAAGSPTLKRIAASSVNELQGGEWETVSSHLAETLQRATPETPIAEAVRPATASEAVEPSPVAAPVETVGVETLLHPDKARVTEVRAPLPDESETGKPWSGEVMRGSTPSRKVTDAGDFGKGSYWTGDGELAAAYARPTIGTTGEIGSVRLGQVQFENPLVFKTRAAAREYRRSIVGDELLDNPQSETAAAKIDADIRSKGHDGVVIYDTEASATAHPERPFEVVDLRKTEPTPNVETQPKEEVQTPVSGETQVQAESPQGVATEPAQGALEKSPTGIRNAIVDKQRVERGLPERMEPLRKSNPEAWDEAMAEVDKNPNAGRQLVADIQAQPRALKPKESALLAHEQVTRENAFDNAVDDVNNAKTDAERLQAQQRLDLARSEVHEIYDAGQRVGTESGQSLQARKLLVNQDYTLARMEAIKRAVANDGKPLSESQLAEVKAAHETIAELRAKLDEFETQRSQEKQTEIYRAIVKEALQSARENAKKGRTLQDTLDAAAAKARERIIARRGQLRVTIDPLNVAGLVDEAIIGASHIARGVTTFTEWSAQMIRDFGDRIKPFLQDLYDRAKALHDASAEQFQKKSPQEVALKRYKTTLENRTEQLVQKMAAGDYTKPVRNKTQLDQEALRLRVKYERARQQFETQIERDRLAKRPLWQKGLEQIAGTARASALSGYHTLLKLAAYDLAKFVETPVTEVVGGAISKVPGVRGIASKANLEAGSTIRPIVDFYAKTLTTGMKEAWRVLRTGKTEAKTLYGKPDYTPPKWYDFFGNLHMAEKAPLVTGTQAMYLRRATENAIKAGLDPSNEFTKAAIKKAVYDHSQKSILQENNIVASAVNGLHARLEAVNPKTGQADIAKATLSTLAKTFLTKGIVRTPANYIAQTIARTPAGLLTGVGKAAMAHARGIENLHPIEANAIHALLKTGAVGSAMFIWGAIDATKDEKDRIFGGYYAPGRKKGGEDVDWGKIRIAGKQLPHVITHNPLTESAQMGNTMMRVARSRFRKRDEDTQGMAKGAVTAIVGLAGKAPIASPLMRAGEGRTDTGADLLSGLVPQLLQNIAEDTDKEERAPQNAVEKIKSTIPGLRQTVPTREEVRGRR